MISEDIERAMGELLLRRTTSESHPYLVKLLAKQGVDRSSFEGISTTQLYTAVFLGASAAFMPYVESTGLASALLSISSKKLLKSKGVIPDFIKEEDIKRAESLAAALSSARDEASRREQTTESVRVLNETFVSLKQDLRALKDEVSNLRGAMEISKEDIERKIDQSSAESTRLALLLFVASISFDPNASNYHPSIDNPQVFQVNVETVLNVRPGPGVTTGLPILTLAKDTFVPVFEERGGWGYISVDSPSGSAPVNGWVSMSYLTNYGVLPDDHPGNISIPSVKPPKLD